MTRTLILGITLFVICSPACAERAPTEEETIAPLVMKQGCWGGVIRYLTEEHRYEVNDAVCGDGSFYYLEFDAELHLIEKKMVRLPPAAPKK